MWSWLLQRQREKELEFKVTLGNLVRPHIKKLKREV